MDSGPVGRSQGGGGGQQLALRWLHGLHVLQSAVWLAAAWLLCVRFELTVVVGWPATRGRVAVRRERGLRSGTVCGGDAAPDRVDPASESSSNARLRSLAGANQTLV